MSVQIEIADFKGGKDEKGEIHLLRFLFSSI
jgi:hypothetical protein